ncbi:MAG TPA: FtsX-like permease family protein, partial [Longimicrobiales bacterium]|nr:FtsX-like permease family protein [Longimicrobiales bacterium]
ARSFWPGEDSPLGRTLVPPWEPAVALRVVAVVGDVRDDGFAADAEPIFYLPWSARPRRRMSWVVRTSPGSARIAAPVREVVERVDADVPVGEVMALEEILASTVDRPRAASLIGGIFALLALLVAAAGIYGVQSYAVRSRTRELGIRSALGATGGDLVTMVLGRSASLLALGLAPGVLGALMAGVGLSGSLFGIPAWDPPSLVLAVTTLGGVGLLAAWLPARRAVRVEPREALRTE